MSDLPQTVVDDTYFTRGYSNGRFETNMWYWHDKGYRDLCANAEATFRSAHGQVRQAFTDVQLLSFIAGYLAGFTEALAEYRAEVNA